ARAKAVGIAVLVVYESTEAELASVMAGPIGKLLQALGLTVICDPERLIYATYRTRSNAWAVLHPQTVKAFSKALASGFRQGAVLGRLGQLPAHFVIGEDGRIELAYYGRHL